MLDEPAGLLYNAHAIGEWLNGRVVVSKTIDCVFESRLPCHVGAKFALLRLIFCLRQKISLSPASLPVRLRSCRSSRCRFESLCIAGPRLLACKRTRHAPACYQPFSGCVRGANTFLKYIEDRFYFPLTHCCKLYIPCGDLFSHRRAYAAASHLCKSGSLFLPRKTGEFYPFIFFLQNFSKIVEIFCYLR